ncbi:hypothetical protein [Dyadobacter sp. CY326]|uniref:hypothetical protein n=1 Tax=Dyadobacter sp. CY326 TaxID=2907300 RepID=UPI001F3D8B9F|nr:hypothetical protein [Dyadobacter sp. CY326]MCE7066669.1 hypothetical protein [Dyadobacter sp. CY326]
MKKQLLSILVIIYVLIIPNTVSAQTPKTSGLEKFDLDKNDSLSIKELKLYLLELKFKAISDADSNKDTRVDDTETKNLLFAFLNDFIRNFGNKQAYSLDQVNQLYPLPRKTKTLGILLRETSEDISPYKAAEKNSKAKASIFSYAHDFGTSANAWVAKGALMRPFKHNETVSTALSVSFNRVVTKDSTKEANSLVPRFGLYLRPRGKGIFLRHLIRLLANYGTDFDFKSSQYGVEAEWEPVLQLEPFGLYWRPWEKSPVEIRLQTFVHSEAGHVLSKGKKEELKSNSTYTRAGGKFGIDLRFFERVELGGAVRYLYGFSGPQKHSKYYTSTFAYGFGAERNTTFKIEFQKGNVPITQEEVNNIVVGLGFKF